MLLLPSIGALAWTVYPAAAAAMAVAALPRLDYKDDDLRDEKMFHELRRKIQKHFLDNGLYVPLEDIVPGTQAPVTSERSALLMQKACGRGKIHVWIPLAFRLPGIGNKVVNWCWNASEKLK